MAARVSVARVARQLTSPALRRPVGLTNAGLQKIQQRTVVHRRLFSVSSAAQVKKYTEDHEWIEFSEDGKICTLGISTYAAKALGDVVYIELPEIGIEISAGDAIGAVESVKSASDILTPVSGTVKEVNGSLEEKPGKINKDPEGEAWIAKLEISGEPEGKTMTEAEYKEFTEDT